MSSHMTSILLFQHIMTKWGFSLQWPDMVSHLATRYLEGLFILLFIYIFCGQSGNAWLRLWVKWHGMADDLHPQWRHFNEMFITYFWSAFHLYPPSIFFQHSQCLRDWDPSEIYISLSFLSKCDIFRWLYLSSYWFFVAYFCLVIS